MNSIKTLRAPAEKNASQVDDRLGAVTNGRERVRVAHIGLHWHDLPGHPQRLDMAGEIGSAAGDPDAKARAAKDGDQRVGGDGGHAALFGVERMESERRGRERTGCARVTHGPPNTGSVSRCTGAPWRGIDWRKALPYLSPHSPGGGIGRRTSFRY